ncbi:hypothetical protein [Halobacterium bonnevillei]|uniref:Uncharacterized protein n=1 Tax=Halobacterium bonnevillei TaxID=2692200 RepID=A0A6B0SKX3_9EURY|nr:hypothetical protein [Halobacterium bonnevillei]MXR21156.1 hypothetical protein [Halobacterium bonnevillei]
MSATHEHLASARTVQAAVVAAATAVGFAVAGAESAFIAAVVGFFGVKSVESLQRALP